MTERCRLVVNHINAKRIALAFSALKPLVQESGSWKLDEELSSLENIYRNSLYYQVQGTVDPQKEVIFKQLVTRLYAVVDEVYDMQMSKQSLKLPYSLRSTSTPSQQAWALACEVLFEGWTETNDVAIQNALDILFNMAFYVREYNSVTIEQFQQLLGEKDATQQASSVIVSAITLSLLQSFDVLKFGWLLSATQSSNKETVARAYVGLVSIVARHGNRLDCSQMLSEQMPTLSQSMLSNAVNCILAAQQTTEITKMINEQLLPKLQKIRPDINAAFRKPNVEEVNMDNVQELLDETGLNDTVRKMSEWALEGADVYEQSFSALRHNPFFVQLSNWLLPFFPQHTQVRAASKSNKLAETLMQNHSFCSSDKYGLTTLLAAMTEEQFEAAFNALNIDSEQLNQISQAQDYRREEIENKARVNNYVRDLYRLFSLHPNRTDFGAPLRQVVAFTRTQAFAELMGVEEQYNAAVMLIRIKQFAAASDLLERLFSEHHLERNAANYKMLALCALKMKLYDKAANYFLAALDYNPDDATVMKHLASTYESLERLADAADIYKKLLESNSNDEKLLMKLLNVQMKTNDYQAALNTGFQAYYINADQPEYMLAIIRCALSLCRFDIATSFAQKLLAIDKQTVESLIVIAIVHLAVGMADMNEAVVLLKRAKNEAKDETQFLTVLKKTEPYIEAAQLDAATFHIATEAALFLND